MIRHEGTKKASLRVLHASEVHRHVFVVFVGFVVETIKP